MAKKRKNQEGQAIAEMTVAMIAILAMVSGFLLISQLGRASVENLLNAKARCDINAMNGLSLGQGSSIRYWEIGDDLLEMSPDDEAMTLTNDDPALFSGELQSGGMRISDLDDYVVNNFADNLSASTLFLEAAGMTSGTQSVEISLDDASRFLYGGSTLFGLESVTIEDTAYSPMLR